MALERRRIATVWHTPLFPGEEKMILTILQALILPGIAFTIHLGLIFEWLERKTMARMTGRVGPMFAGPAGVLQPLADFVKLLYKEEVMPSFADKTVFRYAPGLFFLAPLVSMLFVPVIGPSAVASFSLDLLLIVFILAYATFVVAVLSYASASSFTTVASGRLVLQYVSYEIPLVISIVTPALLVGSLSIQEIVQAQSSRWNLLLMPFSFAVYIVALLAELEKPPFDIPSAKTEILGASLAVALFLGGPLGPVPQSIVPVEIFYTTYFLVKLFALGLLIFVVRTALARLKIIDAAVLFWKILLPLSLAQAFFVLVVKG